MHSQLDNLTKDEIGEVIRKYEIKAPMTNNDLSDPLDFNLMFSTSIGPGGNIPRYNVYVCRNYTQLCTVEMSCMYIQYYTVLYSIIQYYTVLYSIYSNYSNFAVH